MADFHDDGFDDTRTYETYTRSLAHTQSSARINVIEEQRRGKQNFRRKPEVAYPTIPRHTRMSQTTPC